ncbi:MAG: 16S rRNA (cytosine(1402)-N(4))-methyltransferase RsmH [Leptospirillum sp.]|nr:16S rRNA (cytosine(1402)-N(4))-methyltransferase RsmH [Nitrospiraceae bacterium]
MDEILPEDWEEETSFSTSHIPVLLGPAVDALQVSSGDWYVDGTFGHGGHSGEILSRGGNVLAFDVDPAAVERGSGTFRKDFPGRFLIVPENHRNIASVATRLGIQPRGILIDSGWASSQMADEALGMSFLSDSPLDMRMDPTLELSATDLLETLDQEELLRIFSDLGEEPLAWVVARNLVEARSRGHLPRTGKELASFVSGVYYRKGFRRSRRHPATRVFMALRIAVNREIESLSLGITEGRKILSSGGRIVVISFHSREDRVVKHLFRDWKKADLGQVLFQKGIVPDPSEVLLNPRARSARMRAFSVD